MAQGRGTAWPGFLEPPKSRKGPTSYRSPKGTGEVWGGWGRHPLGGVETHTRTRRGGPSIALGTEKVLNKCLFECMNKRSEEGVRDKGQGLGPFGPACFIQKIAV